MYLRVEAKTPLFDELECVCFLSSFNDIFVGYVGKVVLDIADYSSVEEDWLLRNDSKL